MEEIIPAIYKSHKKEKLRRFFPTELFSFFALYQERIMGRTVLSLISIDAFFPYPSNVVVVALRKREGSRKHFSDILAD